MTLPIIDTENKGGNFDMLWIPTAIMGLLIGALYFFSRMFINQKIFENAPKEDKYMKAKALFKAGNYDESMKLFAELEDYKSSKIYMRRAEEKKYKIF